MWQILAGLLFCAVAAPLSAGCGPKETAEVRVMQLQPPRSLEPGEAFSLIVEIGDIGQGSVLTVFDSNGMPLGSMTPAFGLPYPQSARIALIRSIKDTGLQVEIRVHPSDDFTGRAPRDNELLGIQLVPIGVTR